MFASHPMHDRELDHHHHRLIGGCVCSNALRTARTIGRFCPPRTPTLSFSLAPGEDQDKN